MNKIKLLGIFLLATIAGGLYVLLTPERHPDEHE